MDISDLSHLWQLDSRLAVLGRGLGVMRLRIGDLLAKLESLGGIHALGFPTLESYAREALGRSGRWAADARSLARRLESLPSLRSALESGDLTTSMVELVARAATPDDDAEWVARASQMTVRAMRAHLRAESVAFAEEPSRPRTSLTLTVTRLEALAFEQARMMVEALGAPRGDGAVEAILAEGLGELLAREPDIDLPLGICAESDDDGRAERAELALLREQAEAAAESAVPPEASEPISLELASFPAIEGFAAVDAALRDAATELAARDVELAQLARQASESELWRILRYSSFDHYCRERIGLSPSSIATRIALARRIQSLPVVAEALASGRIGYEAATLVARVAGPSTVHAWLERAAERTVKHLREDIDAAELVARVEQRDPREMGPPDADTLAVLHSVERAALRIVTGSIEEAPQMSGVDEPDLPTATLRLTVADDVASFWRALERLHRRPDESFVTFLVRAVTKSWAHTTNGAIAYADVYERDRWRCASPVCRSRDVTPHHVVFRAHGGGEARTNLVSLCVRCHLDLVHLNHLTVSGDADGALEWRAMGWTAAGRLARRRRFLPAERELDQGPKRLGA